MKVTILLFFSITVLSISISCAKNSENSKSEIKKPPSHELVPLLNDRGILTTQQIQNITLIHETFNEVYSLSIEERIQNFRKEINVRQEIELWLGMRTTYELINSKYSYTALDTRKEVFRLILMRTILESNDEVITSLNITNLSMEEQNRILVAFEYILANYEYDSNDSQQSLFVHASEPNAQG